MAKLSLIYRNIHGYRFVMGLLYSGRYRERFLEVIAEIKKLPPPARVLELCFGDTYIAKFCRDNGYAWRGIDLNPHFVSQARKSDYDANCEDVGSLKTLPKAEVCIMIGSLYHFYPGIAEILAKMFNAADRIIISEPVSNLSSQKGLIGFFARKAADAGKGNEEFRFTRESFLKTIDALRVSLDFHIASSHQYGKDFIITLVKNGRPHD